MVSPASHGPAMMRRSVICSSSESVRPHEPETQETLPSHGREELANGSAGRMTGARSGSARGRFQVIRDRMIVTSARVRLEFPILSGESAPPVWRQPNVDHVGSWRATAPGRTVAACVQRALLDSHPVSAKRPEDRGSVHTIVRVGASSRCCCRTARRERSASRRMRRRLSSPDCGVRSGRECSRGPLA